MFDNSLDVTLAKENNQLREIVEVPCKQQTKNWSARKLDVGNIKRISIKLFRKDGLTADFIQLVLFYVAPLLEKVIPYTEG